VVSLVKIDVEGYEFSLLPWLLLRGALCLPNYVRRSEAALIAHDSQIESQRLCSPPNPLYGIVTHAFRPYYPGAQLLIEWHLATLEPQRRLAGLSMRLAFDDLLRDGCATPPVAVLHDGAPPPPHMIACGARTFDSCVAIRI